MIGHEVLREQASLVRISLGAERIGQNSFFLQEFFCTFRTDQNYFGSWQNWSEFLWVLAKSVRIPLRIGRIGQNSTRNLQNWSEFLWGLVKLVRNPLGTCNIGQNSTRNWQNWSEFHWGLVKLVRSSLGVGRIGQISFGM